MIEVGQSFETHRSFSQDDFNRFAELSGDDNPIHVDPTFAAATRFGRTISHGMLLYSVLGAAINTHIPGSRQLAHEMMFPTGTPVGEEISVRIVVEGIDPQAREAMLDVAVVRPGGELGLQGKTRVSLPEAGV